MNESFHVLVFRGESGLYVAICLDNDLGAQGKSPEDAVVALEETYRAYVQIAERRGERPFQHGRRAPDEYWRRYEDGRPMTVRTVGAQVRAA